MNLNSRFAGVSRAARSLIGSTSADALAAAEQPAPAAAASEPAPAGDPPAEAEPEPAAEPDPAPADEPAEPAGADAAPAGEALDGDVKIRGDERSRVATVFACEHCTGRERQAADMLQTSMSADEITGLLAKSPKGGAAADPMLAALTGTKNPDLGASAAAPDTTTRAQAAESVWDKARAKPR